VTEQGLVKVADFGTSRFLEIAAHGTTVIGSPPYMAPEQFQGKAVFASDIYSLGVTMYQMLTGGLPYHTPAPGDIERLMRGELTSPPRDRNQKIPKGISDIVMKAMAPDVSSRYQRASELMEAVLAARARPVAVTRQTPVPAGGAAPARRPWRPAPLDGTTAGEHVDDIQARLRAREAPQPRFCWHCRKALHARADKCPFCGESQR
jgi:serine/threonine protein kinase